MATRIVVLHIIITLSIGFLCVNGSSSERDRTRTSRQPKNDQNSRGSILSGANIDHGKKVFEDPSKVVQPRLWPLATVTRWSSALAATVSSWSRKSKAIRRLLQGLAYPYLITVNKPWLPPPPPSRRPPVPRPPPSPSPRTSTLSKPMPRPPPPRPPPPRRPLPRPLPPPPVTLPSSLRLPAPSPRLPLPTPPTPLNRLPPLKWPPPSPPTPSPTRTPPPSPAPLPSSPPTPSPPTPAPHPDLPKPSPVTALFPAPQRPPSPRPPRLPLPQPPQPRLPPPKQNSPPPPRPSPPRLSPRPPPPRAPMFVALSLAPPPPRPPLPLTVRPVLQLPRQQPPSPPGESIQSLDDIDEGALFMEDSGCADASEAFVQTNTYRLKHRAHEMTWSQGLARSSRSYARELASRCRLVHSGSNAYGENLMLVRRYPPPKSWSQGCLGAVNTWYNEVEYYRWDVARPYYDNNFGVVGHFTQLVWRGSSTVGCGMAVANVSLPLYPNGPNVLWGCQIVVCRYQAPGNVANDIYFLKNVLRPLPEGPPPPPRAWPPEDYNFPVDGDQSLRSGSGSEPESKDSSPTDQELISVSVGEPTLFSDPPIGPADGECDDEGGGNGGGREGDNGNILPPPAPTDPMDPMDSAAATGWDASFSSVSIRSDESEANDSNTNNATNAETDGAAEADEGSTATASPAAKVAA